MAAVSAIRPIGPADLPAVAALLAAGFPQRPRGYWEAGLTRLGERPTPPGTEQYGYVLDHGSPTGVILTISSDHATPEGPRVYTNISSWAVQPSSGVLGPLQLLRRAVSAPEATVTTLSAVPDSLETLRRLGFQCWSEGQVVGIGTASTGQAKVLDLDAAQAAGLNERQASILADHAAMGCLTPCVLVRGALTPLIFLRRRIERLVPIPAAQLIYCAHLANLLPHTGVVWRWLAAHGYPLMIVDASGPLPGIRGRYYPGRAAKYYRGPNPGMDCDHTYSEMVYLGF
jgi:hypothetical protein